MTDQEIFDMLDKLTEAHAENENIKDYYNATITAPIRKKYFEVLNETFKKITEIQQKPLNVLKERAKREEAIWADPTNCDYSAGWEAGFMAALSEIEDLNK